MTDSEPDSGRLITTALAEIHQEISDACRRADREATAVNLIAVTKAFGVEALTSAFAAGLRLFGESRVQESATKLPQFSGRRESEVHLIGHLQSNKVKTAVGLYDVIESVDSLKLLRRIDALSAAADKVTDVYLQVNLTGDQSRFGFEANSIGDLLPHVISMSNLVVRGIMMVAPNTVDETILRNSFRRAHALRDNFRESVPTCQALSMGMSADFALAIEEGATHIRVGRRLFGERN